LDADHPRTEGFGMKNGKLNPVDRATVPQGAAQKGRTERNQYGMLFLDTSNPVAVAAKQAQRVAKDERASFEAVEFATAAAAAWAALQDMRATAEGEQSMKPPSQRDAIRNLPTALVFEIAFRAARASFRAGTWQGLETPQRPPQSNQR
jgi:hypothetical protein